MDKSNELISLRKYFVEKARDLSLTFDDQIKIDSDGFIGESLPEDIANEWMLSDLEYLVKICPSKEKADACIKLYKEIINNFENIQESKENVWNLEALKIHPFWEKQRQLATKLLNELNSIL